KRELDWISKDEEYKNNPMLYASKLFSGLVYPAFGSYSSISIRSRNFSSRIDDIKNVVAAATENLKSSNSTQKGLSIKYIDYLHEFIEHFSNFLLGKSDTEKKDEIKINKASALEELDKFKKLCETLPEENSVWKLEPVLRRKSLDEFPFDDLESVLSESLGILKDKIVKKSREIKISAPYLETLSGVINAKQEISEQKIVELVNTIKNKGQNIFGHSNISVDIRTMPEKIEDLTQSIWNYKHFQMLPAGEFDIRPIATILLPPQDNVNLLILNIVRNIYPGVGYMKEVKSKRVKGYRKNFQNHYFKEGWKLYVLKEMTGELRKVFGNEFELLSMYYEYKSLLMAYLENGIFRNNMDLETLKSLVAQNELVFDKEAFVSSLAEDNGKALAGFVGFNFINGLKKSLSRKYKPIELNERIIANGSVFSFAIARRMIQ
ncbi:MAG: hypothetical protein ACP5GW_06300, partial [Caldisericaceae bacterium]